MREFSHPVQIDPWPPGGVAFHVSAGREARRGLAARLGLEALDHFEVTGRIDRAAGAFLLAGRLRAEVVQICVVTLEPFGQRIDEEVRLELTRDVEAGDALIEPDQVDVVPVEGVEVDLGRVFEEELALRLDPHPRAPGADLAVLEAPLEVAQAPDGDWRARLARHRQALAG